MRCFCVASLHVRARKSNMKHCFPADTCLMSWLFKRVRSQSSSSRWAYFITFRKTLLNSSGSDWTLCALFFRNLWVRTRSSFPAPVRTVTLFCVSTARVRNLFGQQCFVAAPLLFLLDLLEESANSPSGMYCAYSVASASICFTVAMTIKGDNRSCSEWIKRVQAGSKGPIWSLKYFTLKQCA